MERDLNQKRKLIPPSVPSPMLFEIRIHNCSCQATWGHWDYLPTAMTSVLSPFLNHILTLYSLEIPLIISKRISYNLVSSTSSLTGEGIGILHLKVKKEHFLSL